MSFDRLPDRMLGYATYELAQLLARLTQDQRNAIDRIVQHVYIENKPWALLFRDQPAIPISREHPLGRAAIPRICAETNYYRKGHVNEATGKRKRPGWGHDDDFQQALKEAARLALATKERERQEYLQAAKGRAERSAADAVEVYVDIMENGRVEFARIEAAGKVLELAFKGEGTQAVGTSLEHDWWAAADGTSG